MRNSHRKGLILKGFSRYLAPAVMTIAAVGLEAGGEAWRLALRYDRDRLADGDWWRLMSGHFVHLGWSHMLMNVAALAVLAFVLGPYLKTRDWLAAALAGAVAIDAGLYLVHEQVLWYVGLSGLLHGFWAAACVAAWRVARKEAVALTLLLVGKLAYEWLIGPLGFTGAIAAGPVITQAHAWGALGGALSGVLDTAIRARDRPL